MSYSPEHLERWNAEDPAFGGSENYVGVRPVDHYVAAGTNRDADCLTRSNWAVWQRELLPLHRDEAPVEVHRFSHWACGWYELLLVHEDNEAALRKADELRAALADYPVLDEEAFSELEYEEASEAWAQADLRERIEACAQGHVSIFAARHDHLPQDDSGGCFEYFCPN